MAEFRVSLDQEDFAALIRGQEVVRPIRLQIEPLIPLTAVRVKLRDIGWTIMAHELQAAVEEASHGS